MQMAYRLRISNLRPINHIILTERLRLRRKYVTELWDHNRIAGKAVCMPILGHIQCY